MQQTSARASRRKPFPFHIFVFLVPATLIYTVFMIFPLIDSLRLSLFAPGEQGAIFVGLQNYITLLTDELWAERFWRALKNNVNFFLIVMFIQNPLGLLLASLLHTPQLRGASTYRTFLFLPAMLSFVLVGFVWKLILSPLWGISEGLMGLVGLEAYFRPWLGLEGPALVALSLITVWQFVGIPMMLFYAALLGIPYDLIEAAYVDGATTWTVFWHIKFPLILPTVGIVTILTYVGNFNAFDLIFTTQGGTAGPNFSTDVLGMLFYRTFFGFQLQLGNHTMGATVAGMMFLIILAGVLVYLFAWQRRIQTYEL